MKAPMNSRRRIVLEGTPERSFDRWRDHVRALIAEGVPPDRVTFVDTIRDEYRARASVGSGEPAGGLFAETDLETDLETARRGGYRAAPVPLPTRFVQRLSTVACHRSIDVWGVCYELCWRITRGERNLLKDPLDPHVVAFDRMEKAIRRDAHKMHAFVRFRRVDDPEARNGERFVAWYEPSHFIVRREAEFFRRRFPSMDWSILTPDGCSHWDGDKVSFTGGVDRSKAPEGDELEELWCAYYASIFNPARLKLKAMTAEMPKKFWHTLPETAQIPQLIADVPRRLDEMARNSRAMGDSAMPFVPAGGTVEELRDALPSCEGCELAKDPTRPVPGEGRANASIVLLGEQPGDMEEQAGRPFVGPAGDVLARALESASLSRAELYLTNTVKHFRHVAQPEPGRRGKRRLHKRPTMEHVTRCQPWLDAEMQAIKPEVLVCLGATAARSVFGPTFRMPDPGAEPVSRSSRYAATTIVTFHPAAILRAADPAAAETKRSHLVGALRLGSESLGLR